MEYFYGVEICEGKEHSEWSKLSGKYCRHVRDWPHASTQCGIVGAVCIGWCTGNQDRPILHIQSFSF